MRCHESRRARTRAHSARTRKARFHQKAREAREKGLVWLHGAPVHPEHVGGAA